MSDELPEANQALDACLFKVADNLYLAERALCLFRAIGENAGTINAAHWGNPFQALQAALADQFVLCATKVFERPSSRYRILSLNAAAEQLKQAPDAFAIVDRPSLLRYFGDSEKLATSADLSDVELTTLLAELVLDALPDLERSDPKEHDRILDALRSRRDKAIAHSEDVEVGALPRWTWKEGTQLLDLAKGLTGALSRGYTRVIHIDDAGVFVLSDDASRVGRSLERFLSRALRAMSSGPAAA